MTPLPHTFKKWNYTFTQIMREGKLAIYLQQHKDADIKRYEVVRIRTEDTKTWPDGHITEAHEVYPGSATWGKDGFTFFTLPEARAKMQAMFQQAGETVEIPQDCEVTIDQEGIQDIQERPQ